TYRRSRCPSPRAARRTARPTPRSARNPQAPAPANVLNQKRAGRWPVTTKPNVPVHETVSRRKEKGLKQGLFTLSKIRNGAMELPAFATKERSCEHVSF